MYHLIIGNRRYSSWSMRGWLAVQFSAADFETTLIPLDLADTQAKLREQSGAARVPVLKVTERNSAQMTIWDSLSIIEYLAETFPQRPYWPSDVAQRALARSVVAEMHAGFAALRGAMPMDLGAMNLALPDNSDVAADIARILAIWGDCRAQNLANGAFLFGPWSAADMVYAPVVARFLSYNVPMNDVCKSYVHAVHAQAHVTQWYAAAAREPWILENP